MKTQKSGKPLCQSIMTVAMMMLSLQAMAQDFAYTHHGKTLYYNITSGNTAEVTYYADDYLGYNYVSGNLVIPSTITQNGTTYSVTSIGDSALWNCSGLTSVTIPNSVTSIRESAFENCNGLASVTIPTGVTSIGDGAFAYCSGLKSVTIPNSVTSIGDDAFACCSDLTSVTIPNSVTSIGGGAFWNCSGLTSITIPTGVTFIGWGAFSGCSSLTSVRCLAVTPPSIDSNSFSDIPSTCILTVPCGSLGAYAGSDWNKYFSERISEE